jgi:regulator of protease activity HflC (stomatin/prohibitin superfamily)
MSVILKKLTGLSAKMRAGVKEKAKKNVATLVIFVLISLLIMTYLFNYIVYIIKPGEAGIFWGLFTGTKVDYVYPEGIRTVLPYNRMYVYNMRIQEESRTLNVLTRRGLGVDVYYSVRYAPKYKLLGLLHQRVGPDYLNIVILPEIESVLREVIGTMEAEQIWTTGRVVIVKAINDAIEQVEKRYIRVDDVLIKRIELPESVAGAIRFKVEQKHLVEAHEFIVEKEKKEAERKRIEGEGIRDQLSTVAEAIPEGEILKWQGIQATQEIAKSNNAKVVIIGNGKDGLPIILNTDKSLN